MHHLLRTLWQDDTGAIISIEYLFVATILVIGSIVGLSSLRDAINVELGELANATMALSQGYTISGTSSAGGSSDGSQSIDTPSTVPSPTPTPPSSPSSIDLFPGN